MSVRCATIVTCASSSLLVGCYLSHTLETPEDAAITPACVTDADCDDADRCTRDRCATGTCAHDPVPYDRALPVAVPGEGVDVTADGTDAWLLSRDGMMPFILRAVTASTVTGATRELFTPSNTLPPWWDAAVAWTGSDFAVLTRPADTRLLLRRIGSSTTESSLTVEGLTEVELRRAGSRLVATALQSQSGCWAAWIDSDGSWLPGSQIVADGCTGSHVPRPTGPPGIGYPANARPAEVNEHSVVFFSVDEAGNVTRSRASDAREASDETFALDAHALPYTHSFVAVTARGVTGASWVRTDGAADVRVSFAVFDGSLRPLAPPLESGNATGSYALSMVTSFCSERFVAVHSEADEPRVVRQLDARGQAIGAPIRLPVGGRANRVEAACIPGGLVVASFEAVHVLTCGAP